MSVLDKYRMSSGVAPTASPQTPSGSVLDKYRLNAPQSEQDVTPPEDTPGWLSAIGSRIPEPVKTTMGTVLDILGRPGAATAGTIAGAMSDAPGVEGSALQRGWQNLTGERRDDFDTVLAEGGVEDSTGRKVAGFIGDVVVDPLNLLGVGAVRGVIGAGAKAVSKPIGGAIAKADTAAGGFGKRIVDDLGERFVPRYGLELSETEALALAKAGKTVAGATENLDTARKTVKDEFRQFQKEANTIPVRAEQEVIENYRHMPDAQTRRSLADDLHAGAGKTDEADAMVLKHQQWDKDKFQEGMENLIYRENQFNPDHAMFHDFSKAKGGVNPANPGSALSAKSGTAKKRKIEDWEDAKKLGVETDPAIADYHYLLKHNKAVLTSKFVRDMAGKYGLQVQDLAKLDPTDIASFRKLEKFPAESPLRDMLENYYFPEKIAKLLDAQYAPAGKTSTIGEIYNKALQFWRAQATILRPGFHGTNLQGNIFNAWLAGQVHPGRYVEAVGWALGKGPAKIGKYTREQIDDYMHRFGVGGADQSFVSEMIGMGAEKQLVHKLAGEAPKSLGRRAYETVRHPIETGRWVGSNIEDTSKRALFFDGLHRGMSLDEAAKMVDKFLFDYSDLTAFEKNVMRKIFPFYTWMRKNTPLQVENVAKQPYKYAGVEKARHSIEKQTEAEGRLVPHGERPEYMQEAGAVQLPPSIAKLMGTPETSAAFWTPYLPYQDLNNVPIPGGSPPIESIQEIAGGINPVLKGAIELVTNRSLFTKSPIYDSELGMTGDLQKIPDSLEVLTRQIPGLQDKLFTLVKGPDGKPRYEMSALGRYLVQQFPVAEGAGKAAQSLTRPEDASNPTAWMGQTTGVRITEHDAQRLRQQRKAARSADKRVETKLRKQRPVKKREEGDIQKVLSKYLP